MRTAALEPIHRSPRIGFSAVEAAKLNGIPVRTIQHWRSVGFFKPVLIIRRERTPNHGRRKDIAIDLTEDEWIPTNPSPRNLFYSFAQVVGLRVVWDLLNSNGLSREALAGADIRLHGRFPEDEPHQYENLICFDEAWLTSELPWEKWAQEKQDHPKEEDFLIGIISGAGEKPSRQREAHTSWTVRAQRQKES